MLMIWAVSVHPSAWMGTAQRGSDRVDPHKQQPGPPRTLLLNRGCHRASSEDNHCAMKRPETTQKRKIVCQENTNPRSRHESTKTHNRMVTINPMPKNGYWRFPSEAWKTLLP